MIDNEILRCSMGRCCNQELIDEFKAIISEMSEVISFYGDRDKWSHMDNGRGYDMYYIDDTDIDFEMGRGRCGGKRARALKGKYPEVFAK